MNKSLTGLLTVLLVISLVGNAFLYSKFSQNNSNDVPGINANSSFTQSSKEYALMSRALWSAFQCSSLAGVIGNAKEQERLFSFGYEEGQKFLGALKAGKITQEDISQEEPLGVGFLLNGPSNDFILGRIYESTQEEGLKDVFYTDSQPNSDETQKTIAQNDFQNNNCELLGK